MSLRLLLVVLGLAGFLYTPCYALAADTNTLEQRVHNLEERSALVSMKMGSKEVKILDKDTSGLVMFLFGCVCALWAQNSGRGAWTWFFLGLFLGPVAAVAMLWKNSHDRLKERIRRLDS
jgi:Na+/melibiose symporter-like transporter